ncbi:MAG: hypothetical protein P4K83_02320 [Terracidiphilus sp.]|nr:hypothetical protein [Terracidiphilus sp.]
MGAHSRVPRSSLLTIRFHDREPAKVKQHRRNIPAQLGCGQPPAMQ